MNISRFINDCYIDRLELNKTGMQFFSILKDMGIIDFPNTFLLEKLNSDQIDHVFKKLSENADSIEANLLQRIFDNLVQMNFIMTREVKHSLSDFEKISLHEKIVFLIENRAIDSEFFTYSNDRNLITLIRFCMRYKI